MGDGEQMQMAYDIEPYVGVGPIRFGMTRDEVRAAVGAEVRAFRRDTQEGGPDDLFPTLGFFVYYGALRICAAVEFSRLASPTLRGRGFFDRPYTVVRRWLRALDPTLAETLDGLRSYQLGIALSAPSANELSDDELIEEDEVVLESVLAFERGYYERHACV